MNTNKIKRFATTSREELIKAVELEATKLGITKENYKNLNEDTEIIDGKVINQNTKLQRKELLQKMKKDGFENTIEEIAYTWFNRIIAIKYMEHNKLFPKFIPSYVSILESKTTEPQITQNPSEIKYILDLDNQKTAELYEQNKPKLFKYIMVHLCNRLNKNMPFMFEEIADYTELLFPSHYLFKEFHQKMEKEIEKEDWEQIELLGWLYQFYIADKKDILMNSKKAYKKNEVPAVTQLFTPKWIVKYMVENSLGKIWVESYPETHLKEKMEYYIEEEKQEKEVEKQLEKIRYKNVNPENITFLDPACGSGHILVYAFDIFYSMYEEKGYIKSEIPEKILKNNLFGLDIDKRAAQLANFAVIMKARQKNRNILEENITPHIQEIKETNTIQESIELLTKDMNNEEKQKTEYIINKFIDAKEYGSILEVEDNDYDFIIDKLNNLESQKVFEQNDIKKLKELLPDIIKQANILKNKYDVVSTNPPYLGSKGMNKKLKDYLKKYFKDSKTDMFAVFIERNLDFLKPNGFNAMITMQSWMFLSSFEKLRGYLLNNFTIINMNHLGPRAFKEISGEVVQAVSFSQRNIKTLDYIANYSRLVDYKNAELKEIEFKKEENWYTAKQNDFKKIPGSPIAYWVSDKIYDIFENSKKLSEFGDARQGLATSDNKRFLRLWHEVSKNNVGFGYENREQAKESGLKWFPYNKGGDFRKWYGNNDYIVNWENDGYEIRNFFDDRGKLRSRPQNTNYYFREGLTWSKISSSKISFRQKFNGNIFDVAGTTFFPDENILYLNGVLNSKLSLNFLYFMSPTLNYEVGQIKNIPIIFPKNEETKEKIDEIVKENIEISKKDWDSFETSWDFKTHPILEHNTDGNIENAFENWKDFAEKQFNKLWQNEEKLNKIFLKIYDLEDKMTPDVEEKDVTINKADKERDIKSFISYAVGCIAGRYSPDKKGLIYAGGEFNMEEYPKYKPDEDGIIPVLKHNLFSDDIVEKFIEFVKYTFGEEHLKENLDFIADTLKKNNKDSKQTIREYFIKDFYKDHVKTYKKRPIYWMFDSGNNNSFKALIYLHRYNKDTISKLRTDYIHEYQQKLETEISFIQSRLENSDNMTARDKKELENKLKDLKKDLKETRDYEEKVHHFADQRIEIDLDDGVKNNYSIFQDILVNVKL
ncbi:BREX-1 system adenine-specific DNA-methyltransferase PglX [Geotoga petraea]|uniref:site-specific DNA-methyltransferase (adenine-specific) n=1 Tax=Geotoga petraea TaxID=28234 RepID=A0A1G6MLT1_9BACT|nr:BREX-1 system adenine-specific DNA-methyltransferase PglX [Geotoga petraea]SDC56450.1 Methyltransferase domain-containing protein [Geotoga petraea]